MVNEWVELWIWYIASKGTKVVITMEHTTKVLLLYDIKLISDILFVIIGW